MLTKMHLFDQKLQYELLYKFELFSVHIYFKLIYSCDGKAEFSTILCVTRAFRNHSNMLFAWKYSYFY